ncbi:hypothetical protein SAMN04487845_108270 [Methylobacterium sp. yr668]|nr:hypothetical protein SAMN04487845_108270 [Methylobacterium sp. yr668]
MCSTSRVKGRSIMLSPIDALQKLRDQMVMNRRKLVDQEESIQNVQAEIEAIDRAIKDEETISKSTGSEAT